MEPGTVIIISIIAAYAIKGVITIIEWIINK